MDRKLLELLVCPATHQPLQRLDSAQRERINSSIQAGALIRGDGRVETAQVLDGLVTRDGRTVYRIDDDIPVLLIDDSLQTASIDGLAAPK